MQKKKKKWEQPVLTVLTKAEPSESVLVNCKNVGSETGQNYPPDDCTVTSNCSAIGS